MNPQQMAAINVQSYKKKRKRKLLVSEDPVMAMSEYDDLRHQKATHPRSESVTRHSPEQKCQGCHDSRNEDRHPYSSTQKKFSYIGLLDSECSERCCLGLAEKDKNGIKLILMRDKEKDGE